MSSSVSSVRSAPALAGARQLLGDYFELTKPKVQTLLLFTTITTMEIAGSPPVSKIALTCLGGYLSAGGAGAVPPLVGWAATRGSLSWTAVYLFAIVFYWTPPHFWSLSLLMKDEYAKVDVPMMPVVRGERETRRQILLYTLLLYAVSQLPFCAGEFGRAYLVGSILLGLMFIGGAVLLYRRADRRTALRLYLFSLAYLALLFGAMVADVKL